MRKVLSTAPPAAVQTLQERLRAEPLDFMRVKTGLLCRVAQPPSGPLKMARAEPEPAGGRRKQAAPAKTGAGYRAARLLTMDAAQRRDPAAVWKFIADQPHRAGALSGRECPARFALQEGDWEETGTLYGKFAAGFVEAKGFPERGAPAAKQRNEAQPPARKPVSQTPEAPP